MKVKKLEGIPIAGEYPEIIFESDRSYRDNNWNYVLFTTSNYEDWIGMFRDDDLANFKVAELENGIACIVSGGHGYIVDIDNKQKLKDLETKRIVDIISDSETKSFFISTWYSLIHVRKDLEEINIEIPIQTESIYFGESIDRTIHLVIDEIGADVKPKNNSYCIDLSDMSIRNTNSID